MNLCDDIHGIAVRADVKLYFVPSSHTLKTKLASRARNGWPCTVFADSESMADEILSQLPDFGEVALIVCPNFQGFSSTIVSGDTVIFNKTLTIQNKRIAGMITSKSRKFSRYKTISRQSE